jgi:peptide/nickel transport system substrate-binding protein
VQPQIEPLNVWSRRLNGNDLSMFMIGHAGLPQADALATLLDVVHSRTATEGGLNAGRYSNPAIDALITQASRETDQAKRFALMREAFRLEREDVAHVPLHQQPIVWAAKRNIELRQGPDNRLRLWHVTVN